MSESVTFGFTNEKEIEGFDSPLSDNGLTVPFHLKKLSFRSNKGHS